MVGSNLCKQKVASHFFYEVTRGYGKLRKGGEIMEPVSEQKLRQIPQQSITNRTPEQQVQIFVMQINLRPQENKKEALDKLVGYINELKIDPASSAGKSLIRQISAKLEEIQDPDLKEEALTALRGNMK
jgi:hypothetical protein